MDETLYNSEYAPENGICVPSSYEPDDDISLLTVSVAMVSPVEEETMIDVA